MLIMTSFDLIIPATQNETHAYKLRSWLHTFLQLVCYLISPRSKNVLCQEHNN